MIGPLALCGTGRDVTGPASGAVVPILCVLLVILAGCSSADSVATPPATAPSDSTETLTTLPTTTGPDPDAPATDPTEPSTTTIAPLTRPDWLGQRTLPTGPDGLAPAQPTPPELLDRAFPTVDSLPPPSDGEFTFTIGPLDGEPLQRSTWTEGCPVPPEDLRYITLSFWGFDGEPHTGELIVHADQADGVVAVFAALHEERFPIEEMRVVTDADLTAAPTGDGNNTASFVCRAVTGGSRFSEHAYGLAIDINPFHNPYRRGDVVLPELASAFLDRESITDGMIGPDSTAVVEFARIGWEWGGDWSSLEDYQHFALNNR